MCQGHAAHFVDGGVIGRLSMQGAKKLRQAQRLIGMWLGAIGCVALEPGQDAPFPWIAAPRLSHSHRHRNGDGKPSGDSWQPTLFVLNERGGKLASRQTDQELVAEAEHDVVPPRID